MTQEELIYKLSVLQQQAQQIDQQLQIIGQNINDLSSLKLNLESLKGSKGKEILAMIGRGIFVKSKILSEDLTVDIGGKNFVKKNIPETQKLIQKQIEKMSDVKHQLVDEMEKINIQLQDVVKDIEKERK